MSTAPLEVLLVIPCFREGGRLGGFLAPLCEKIAEYTLPIRVLVVDDGSGEVHQAATERIVSQLRVRFPFLLPPLLNPKNHGKGGAIYSGWNHGCSLPDAHFSWIGFADADGATSASEVCRLAQQILATPDAADVWLASRVKMLGRQVDRTIKRHFLGRMYATLATLATGLAVYDSQCGCKFFRRALYEKVRGRLQDQRFGFDMELLTWMAREGARMVEFPVDWRDIPGSKVHLLRDSWRMFSSLFRLHLRLRGK